MSFSWQTLNFNAFHALENVCLKFRQIHFYLLQNCLIHNWSNSQETSSEHIFFIASELIPETTHQLVLNSLNSEPIDSLSEFANQDIELSVIWFPFFSHDKTVILSNILINFNTNKLWLSWECDQICNFFLVFFFYK